MAPLPFQKIRKQGVIWVCRDRAQMRLGGTHQGGAGLHLTPDTSSHHQAVASALAPPSAWIFEYGQDFPREAE